MVTFNGNKSLNLKERRWFVKGRSWWGNWVTEQKFGEWKKGIKTVNRNFKDPNEACECIMV